MQRVCETTRSKNSNLMFFVVSVIINIQYLCVENMKDQIGIGSRNSEFSRAALLFNFLEQVTSFFFFFFWVLGGWRQRASHLLRLPSGGIWDDSPSTQIGQSDSATSITDDEGCESHVQSHVTISLISFIWNWYLRKESLLILDINRRLLKD